VTRAPAVRRAAVLLAVEGAALAGLGIVDAVAAATTDPANRGAAYGVAVVAVVAGAVLLLLARGVDRVRAWARTPAIVLQVLALPVGIDQVRGGAPLLGVLVLLLAGGTMYHLVVTARAFGEP
jgi:hypothetical protein